MALIDKFNDYDSLKKATRVALFEEFYQQKEHTMEKNGGIKYEELKKFFNETAYTIAKDVTQKDKIGAGFFEDPENNKISEKYFENNLKKFGLTPAINGGIIEFQNGNSLSEEEKIKIEKEIEEKYKKVPSFLRKILDTDTQVKLDTEKALKEEAEKNGANSYLKKTMQDMATETAGYVNEIIQDPQNEYVTLEEMKAIRKFFVEDAKDVKLDPYYNIKNMTKEEQEKIKEKDMENSRMSSESEFYLEKALNIPNFRNVKIPKEEMKEAVFNRIEAVRKEHNIKPKEKVVKPEDKVKENDDINVDPVSKEMPKVTVPEVKIHWNFDKDDKKPDPPKPKQKVKTDREMEM